jgi:hypothetical protein
MRVTNHHHPTLSLPARALAPPPQRTDAENTRTIARLPASAHSVERGCRLAVEIVPAIAPYFADVPSISIPPGSKDVPRRSRAQ